MNTALPAFIAILEQLKPLPSVKSTELVLPCKNQWLWLCESRRLVRWNGYYDSGSCKACIQ